MLSWDPWSLGPSSKSPSENMMHSKRHPMMYTTPIYLTSTANPCSKTNKTLFRVHRNPPGVVTALVAHHLAATSFLSLDLI